MYATLENKTVSFDIETDGLKATKVWCICIQEAIPGAPVMRFRPHEVERAVRLLETAKAVIAHNGIVFDIRVLQRLYNFKCPQRVWDTLVLSRLLFGHLKEAVDFELRRRAKAFPDTFTFPGKMTGRHGLEAWGYRLGLHKGDYAKDCAKKGIDPWGSFNEDMLEYCAGDVEITTKLWLEGIKPRLQGHVSDFRIDVEVKKSILLVGEVSVQLLSRPSQSSATLVKRSSALR